MRESILDSELAQTTIAPAASAWMGRWFKGNLGLFLILWLGAVAWPLSTLISFATTPGQSGAAITAWPRDTQLRIDLPSSRHTLLLFLHSRCACSRASIHELEQIVRQGRDHLNVHVVLYRPSAGTQDDEDLWMRARAIPSVTTHWDEGGVESRRFGSLTSGDALLWSPRGELLYRGGITASRGHIGASPGQRAILSFLKTGTAATDRAPVFGCPIAGRAPASLPPKESP